MEGFVTPPRHKGFIAKKLFGPSGEIIDGAIAYVEPNGGGPDEKHTHPHSHLFTVISGRARIEYGEETVFVNENESFLVDGNVPHSVWNDSDGQTVMLGISVKK